jgi:hypothetical protein
MILLDIRGKKACGGAYLFRQDTPLPNHSLTNGGYHPIFDEDITIYEPDDSALPTCILLETGIRPIEFSSFLFFSKLFISPSLCLSQNQWQPLEREHTKSSSAIQHRQGTGKGGKKPKGTQGVHTLYRLEFLPFFRVF